MISIEELKGMAKLRNLSIGNAEKDYLITLMLFIISGKTKGELVFKGGTCLSKFYGLNRFSENIDFTAVSPIDVEKITGNIVSGMEGFGVKCQLKEKREPYNSALLTFRCEGCRKKKSLQKK
ncbi:MAG: nucleotidyl transferase AbiEii/AbiGii toxin family protein [Candidatus Aenigmarchaeota archaeon]|nr:nucleotidyl transferase AbiEii/AbiGii toxin family protein [Candidatus Aenigmarchaeota archaeon]